MEARHHRQSDTRGVPKPRLMDVVVASAVLVACLLELWVPAVFGSGKPLDTSQYALTVAFLISSAALLFRFARPLEVVLVVCAVLSVEFVGYGAPEGLGLVVLLVVAAYSVAGLEARERAVIGLVAVVVTGVVWTTQDPLHDTLASQASAMIWIAPAGVAWILGRLRRAEDAERARREAESRRVEALRAAEAERARIAREMHDVVAHSLSVMVVQAEAAEEMLERSREDEAREQVRRIEEAGRSALVEMRRALSQLREGPEVFEPQPGLALLPDLVAAVRAGGIDVELAVQGEIGDVPPAADLTAYRVVQEALTNIARHAGRTTARVQVSRSVAGLQITVEDDGSPEQAPILAGRGYGRGLLGMRERVELLGGTLETSTRTPRRGFRVSARIPAETP